MDESCVDEYNSYKPELDRLYTIKAKGSMVRSKAKFIEFNEKPTKYFFNTENANYKNKHIRKLIIDKETITCPYRILREERLFYKQLYSEQSLDDVSYYDQLTLFDDLPSLDDEDMSFCDRPISLEEVTYSLQPLSNNKTPGSDGFTAEFYKFFWPQIKDIVFDSFVYAYNTGELSIEQRCGILNIIPKKEKDIRHLKNWLPISLLNTDYKILTKLLSLRLQNVISTIVAPDQTGYIKNRCIGENIRTVVDSIDFLKEHNKPGILLQLDFEKAFDSVSWKFLQITHMHFGFGENFRKWIATIYKSPQCCVTNNGYHSEFFQISRGIRQGCPISALLFILVVEVMAKSIRKNDRIKGIQLNDKTIKISQLADDMTLLVQDIESVKAVLGFLSDFSIYSGLKLNASKTEAVWLGRNVNKKDKPLGLHWNNDYFKCLGIW